MNAKSARCIICGREYIERHEVLFTICPRCTEEMRKYREWQNTKRKLFGEFRRWLDECNESFG